MIRKETILQLIIPVFFFLIILKFYSASLSNVATILYIGLGYVALIISLISKSNKANIIKWMFFIIYIGVLNALLSSLITDNYRIQDVILLFSYIGIAFIPFIIRLSYPIYKWCYIILLLFFGFHIVKGTNPTEIFSISRNFISVVLLIAASYHIISAHQNNKKISLILLISSLVLSIWATGRSGIIVFTLLLLSVILIDKKYKKYRVYFVSLLLIVVYLIYIFLFSDLLNSGLVRFVNYGIEDSARSGVNTEYIAKMKESFLYILTGAPLKEVQSIVALDLNPHNSIIRLHIYYGLLGVLCLSFLLIKTSCFFIREKNYIYLSLLICLLLRSLVDSTSFHGPLDPLLFYLLFLFLDKKSNENEKEVIEHI
ncbi:MAG: hypothetical protein PHI03_04780 [Bacteroidales bacterium]|jgi:hypothetical protein|nr:hypothetical protein [Bacteroidales bacterium]